jgi:hypothetical protein
VSRPTSVGWFLALILAATLIPAAACDKKTEIDGVGSWHLGGTTRKDGYVCTPQSDGITFCSQQPPMAIAEQEADVLLYFKGHEKSAPLIEIILSIDRCKPEGVVLALESQLGAAHEIEGNMRVWTGKAAVILAQLPTKDGRCEISFVDPTDTKRIAQIRS